MGLSLVRCPFCDRRYNVTGLPSGTKVLCTSCRAILTVPGERFVKRETFWRRLVPRSSVAQAATAILGGLVLAAGGLMAIRSAQVDSGETVIEGPPSTNDDRNPDRRGTPSGGLWSLLSGEQQKEFNDRDRFAIHASTRMDPFILVGEKNPLVSIPFIFNYYEGLLPKLLKTFMTEFGAPLGLGEIREKLLIVLYTRRESWEAWWSRVNGRPCPQNVTGVYSYLERRVSIYFDFSSRILPSSTTKEVLLHEAVHQIIDYYYRERVKEPRPTAWWFQEGMGNYFEGYYETPGGETILKPSAATSRLPMAKELVKDRNDMFINLQKLLTWDVDDIWQDWYDKAGEPAHQMMVLQYAYAQSWAFIHFLLHSQDGLYRPFLIEYFRSELAGRGGWVEFNRLIKLHHDGLDLPELQNRFIKYVENLK